MSTIPDFRGVDFFHGRTIVIATMHGKEQQIGPLIHEVTGMDWIVPDGINTDEFGTFTGEVKRQLSPIETLRLKCKRAMEMKDSSIAIASEGSFGPHPYLFISHANEELVMFRDELNDIELIGRYLTTETNFNGKTIYNEIELMAFLNTIPFPSHAVHLKRSKCESSFLLKGVQDMSELLKTAKMHLNSSDGLWLETDMRAMNNPTRQKAIVLATRDLINKVKSLCTNCAFPGFEIKDKKLGLPCKIYGKPTQSTLCYVYECKKCAHTTEQLYPNERLTEDPQFCDFCNP